jgi:hypothetical protein
VAEQGQLRRRLGAIVNDWQVNGVLAAFSGNPFTVTASGMR